MPTLKSGRYEIPEKWNTATMGRWVIGKDTTTGKAVFIKEFMNYRYPKETQGRPELIRVEQRAEKFANQMRKINEEVSRIAGSGGDVIVTTDFFREGVSLYKVTECVDKVEWSEDRKKISEMLSVEQVDDMMLRIVFAMSALHNAKLLHCDLKPENVFIVKKEGRYVGMVSDFDDSFFINDVPNGADVVGTLEYMSPELALHKISEEDEPPIPLTPASDLFALGLMYHEYLTGDMPEFDMDRYGALWEVMLDDSEDEKAGIYKISDRLDIAHRILIERMLFPDPDGRLPNCSALRTAISNIRTYRNREYKITVMNGGAPLSGKEVTVYAKYTLGSGEVKQEVTNKVISTKTGRDGSLILKGLPSDASYQLHYGKEKKEIAFREGSGGYEALVQIGTVPPSSPQPAEYVLQVTCDGKAAANVKVKLGRRAGGKEKVLPVKLSDARGRIVFPSLPADGSYWVECEGIRKSITWDKKHKSIIALNTRKVKVTRGGRPYQTEIKMMLCSGESKRVIASGMTDAAGLFSFRSMETAQTWKAICDEKEMDVAWNAKYECELKLSGDVKLTLNAYIHGSDPRRPVAGARMVVAQKQDGKMTTLAAKETGANGRVEMGAFPEGEYYIGVVSVPEGYAPVRVKLKHPVRVMLEGESASRSITFEKTSGGKASGSKTAKKKSSTENDQAAAYVPENPEDIVSDQAVALSVSKKWGRVIHYGNGTVMIVRRDGGTRKVTNSQLGLYGLENYRK